MRQLLVGFFVLGIFCATVSAQTNPTPNVPNTGQPPKPEQPQSRSAPASEEYVIGPQDVLQINVWKEPELTAKVTVRPDGKIGVPLLNDIQASGLTASQLQEHIAEGLSVFVAEPSVSVIVIEIHSKVVHIIGSVIRPGVYPLGGPMTVVELLARAGGLAEFAKSKEIRIVRQEPNGSSWQFPFNYNDFAEGKTLRQNIQLRSGDVVIVP